MYTLTHSLASAEELYKEADSGASQEDATNDVESEAEVTVTIILSLGTEHHCCQKSQRACNTTQSIIINERLVLLFLLPFTRPNSFLSITGRVQTGDTVHAGFCMFPQSCDLRTENAGSLKCVLDVTNAYTHWTSVYRLI
jgi:hypothetical protein